jgi:hypothetical protein
VVGDEVGMLQKCHKLKHVAEDLSNGTEIGPKIMMKDIKTNIIVSSMCFDEATLAGTLVNFSKRFSLKLEK